MSRPRWLTQTAAGMIAVALVFGFAAYQRRWMSDDGLIFVRSARQILEGNGPVINVLERAEACTSTVWLWILALFSGVAPFEASLVAVILGWLFAVAAVVIAMDAARRWHRARGVDGRLMPAGILVVVGVFPFWDFATSGLETALSLCWLATTWWLLVQLDPQTSFRRRVVAAAVFGLGPLVRPDFAIVSLVFCVAMWLLVRPRPRQTLALLAIALALPVGYEIFRAGYYGVLVPLPALAKSATGANWSRGIAYLLDFHAPYQLWIPFVVLGLVVGVAARRGSLVRRDHIVIAAPALAAAVIALFVIRVGGDFMHGRMLLPSTFLLVLPAALLPLQRLTAPAIGALAVWTVVIAVVTGDGENHATAPSVGDERLGYIWYTKKKHPVRAVHFTRRVVPAKDMIAEAQRTGQRRMITEGGVNEPMNPAWPTPLVYVAGRLGTGGALVPLDAMVVDTLGLGNPFGAHITPTYAGMPGHEKSLPFEWVRAEFTDPLHDDHPTTPRASAIAHRAARHALSCGELAELLASAREPMSLGRFWANLTGSLRRTRLVVPSDPIEAEWKFCRSIEVSARVSVSSANPDVLNWSKVYLVDGVRESHEHALGFGSEIGPTQWIELRFAPRPVSRVILYPASYPSPGDGFPIDVRIQVWKDGRWVDRATRTDLARPQGPETFAWQTPDMTDRVRVYATRLPETGGGPRLQLVEVEVR